VLLYLEKVPGRRNKGKLLELLSHKVLRQIKTDKHNSFEAKSPQIPQEHKNHKGSLVGSHFKRSLTI
jgi:hypothetical protein